MIKKLSIMFLVFVIAAAILSVQTVDAKKSKKGGISEEQMTTMSSTLDRLTKKMYGRGLFSPEDNEDLMDVKIKMDDQMLIAPDPAMAPMYYRIGVILKNREMKDDAVECFQTVLENFADTALAPKSAAQLKAMGVVVALPGKPGAAAGP